MPDITCKMTGKATEIKLDGITTMINAYAKEKGWGKTLDWE